MTEPRIPSDAPARIRESRPSVVVIGDFLLDGWWSGRVDRVTREAPAPIVEIQNREYAPGGAANTAMNLAALGAHVRAIGLIGDDEPGRILSALLREAGVEVSDLIAVSGARTTTKYRILAGEQVMLRLDDLPPENWPEDALRRLRAAAAERSKVADAEVICDYDGGTLADALVTSLVARERRPPLCVVDAHNPARWRALAPDLVTPNAAEASRLLGLPVSGEHRLDIVVQNRDDILAETRAAAAVVTLDRDGTVLLRAGEPPHRTRAHPALEKQASGAGDVFVAALTVARASGFELTAAADVGQLAADIAVQKAGTCVCTMDELERRLGNVGEPPLTAEELAARLAEHRKQNRRVVFTNGCFDVLHRGHTAYLRQAKELGDVLVVALNDDESVRRLKGPSRPINPLADRANVLAALSCVDYVTVFSQDTPSALIELLAPDVYAKGGDYTPQMLEETEIVRAVGGEVVILDYVPAQSTTALVDRIRSSSVGESSWAGGASS